MPSVSRVNGRSGPYDSRLPENYGRNAQYNQEQAVFRHWDKRAELIRQGQSADSLPLFMDNLFVRFSPVKSSRETMALNAIGWVKQQIGLPVTARVVPFQAFLNTMARVAGLAAKADEKQFSLDEFKKTRTDYFRNMHDSLDINGDGEVSVAERASDMLFYDAPYRWTRLGLRAILKDTDNTPAETDAFESALDKLNGKCDRIDGSFSMADVADIKAVEGKLDDAIRPEKSTELCRKTLGNIYDFFNMARYEQ